MSTNGSAAAAPWVVLKFGGTSVATRERWETIELVARRRLEEPARIVLVCSAVAGISNTLDGLLDEAVAGRHPEILAEIVRVHEALASDLGVEMPGPAREALALLDRIARGVSLVESYTPRLKARVMAQGEVMLTLIGHAFLRMRGVAAEWVDARELLEAEPLPAGTSEQRQYLSVHCAFDRDPALNARLAVNDARAVITQGFIARNARDETVLLGRGGSDTSAAYLAARLGAARLEIWTDVAGIYSADPHEVPSARVLRQVDVAEAQEIATMGAKVLHPGCLAPVRRHRIPLRILCTADPDLAGTLVTAEPPPGGPRVKAIATKRGVTLVSMESLGMWQQAGFLADIFTVFKTHAISIDLVSTSETNVTVSLDPAANVLDEGQLSALIDDLSRHCRVRILEGKGAISLIGREIRAVLHRLGPALELFEAQPVHLVSQAASDLNLTLVVDDEQAPRLVRELHHQLFEGAQGDAAFGESWLELHSEEAQKRAEIAPEWWRERRDDLVSLAEREGPLYVYDEKALRAAADELHALRNIDRVLYAIKANPNPDILDIFIDEGLGFECVSIGELEHLRSHLPELEPFRVLFTPNFAPRSEYEAAFELGARVTLDNLHPLERWPDTFRGREIFLRVDPERGRGHHRHVRTAGAESKFGVGPEQLERVGELAKAADVSVIGLHAHAGSGIRNPGHWREVALFLADVAEQFPDVRVLDLGGGLGVPERAGQSSLDLRELDEALGVFREAWPKFRLWLEPGRFLVARAGVLLARVTQIKQKGDVKWVGVETGINSLIRPALYGAYHEIVNLTRLDEPATMQANVVGPICETGDTLGYNRLLAPTEEGDVLLIADAGAYGRAMSSWYNLREPARDVVLRAFLGMSGIGGTPMGT